MTKIILYYLIHFILSMFNVFKLYGIRKCLCMCVYVSINIVRYHSSCE